VREISSLPTAHLALASRLADDQYRRLAELIGAVGPRSTRISAIRTCCAAIWLQAGQYLLEAYELDPQNERIATNIDLLRNSIPDRC
jgi:hypothetical protein